MRLLEQFDRSQPTYEALWNEAVSILETANRNTGLKVHDESGRVKDRDSFRTKAIKHRYPNPLSDVHDIVDVRVVCLFLEDPDTVDAIVQANFDVLHKEHKPKEAPPEYFGYRADHYDCQIRSSDSDTTYGAFRSMVFETQVRTIGQDA